MRRPEVEAYTESEFLDARALARLLGAIPRDTVGGLRDYALFLGYVLTGAERGVAPDPVGRPARARGADLITRGGGRIRSRRGMSCRRRCGRRSGTIWSGRAGWGPLRCPRGRSGPGILCLRRCRITGARSAAECEWWGVGGEPGDLGGGGEPAAEAVRAAGGAGRRADPRARAASLGGDAGGGVGASLTRISEFLGHADPKTTMRYLRHLRGNGDETWEGEDGNTGTGRWTIDDSLERTVKAGGVLHYQLHSRGVLLDSVQQRGSMKHRTMGSSTDNRLGCSRSAAFPYTHSS